MNTVQIGKFIAKLRKEKGLTQEQLGEKLGVTNKTISRWETGIYLPPADALISMSELFSVSINEILSGKTLSAEEYKDAAEENLAQSVSTSAFSLKDRIGFFKKKWLREHIAIMVFIGICIIAIFAIGLIYHNRFIKSAFFPAFLIAHVWRYNTMMSYVEKNAYDGKGSGQ